MVCFYQLALISSFLFVLLAHSRPIDDPQVREFIENEARSMASSMPQRRHLRPVYETRTKRDSITPPDVGQIGNFNGSKPQPIRGNLGDTFLSGSNYVIDEQNIDNVAPPNTDSGVITNLKWSMSLSHSKLVNGGWVREQTITDLPVSKDIAAAEIRLSANAYRELHWHRVAEWGYVLGGTGRISAVDEDGRTYISDINGPTNGSDPDIYYFPPGVPHNIQALENGVEILLLFSDGNFDASGTTFMLSDWLAHTPLEIAAQNLGFNYSELAGVPQKDPYILKSTVPPPQAGYASQQAKTGPNGQVPMPYVFSLSQQPKMVAPGGGGWIKIQDSMTNFPISTLFASALVYVEPNGLRELHWHQNDEWLYILSGNGRATAFSGGATARTFDFQTGDTGVFPVSYGHYMKNLSPTQPLIFLEIFKAPKYVDFSLTQWMALSPSQAVADLLNITVSEANSLPTTKQIIKA